MLVPVPFNSKRLSTLFVVPPPPQRGGRIFNTNFRLLIVPPVQRRLSLPPPFTFPKHHVDVQFDSTVPQRTPFPPQCSPNPNRSWSWLAGPLAFFSHSSHPYYKSRSCPFPFPLLLLSFLVLSFPTLVQILNSLSVG